jgi:phage shock protein A
MEEAVEPTQDGVADPAKQLSEAVARLESEAAALRSELAVAERARDLALDEITRYEERIAQVRALVDLAAWATEADDQPTEREPTIRLSDLRRAIG